MVGVKSVWHEVGLNATREMGIAKKSRKKDKNIFGVRDGTTLKKTRGIKWNR